MINPASRNLVALLRDDSLNVATVFEHGGTTAKVIADAVDIADSCARSDIECDCPGDADGWYDTIMMPEDHDAWLAQSLRYLEARDSIERHPTLRHRVRFKKVTP